MHLADLADELGVSTVTLVATCTALGIDARWAGAEVSDEDAERIRQAGPAAPAAEAPAPPFGAVAGGPWAGTPPAVPFVPPEATGPTSWAVGARPSDDPTQGPLRPGQQGRRDPTVSSGLGYWWKSVAVIVATTVVVVILALFFGSLAVVGVAYSHHSGSSRGVIALIEGVFLVGLGWATLLQVHAANSALDAWNRITSSRGALHGRGLTTFMTITAVLSCCNLLWSLISAVWIVIAV